MPTITPEVERASTVVLKIMTGQAVAANTSLSTGPYHKIDGYRHVNVFVEFDQRDANESPVNLGVLFAFDAAGTFCTRCYANLEPDVPSPQPVNFIEVSGAGSWQGAQWNLSRYVARFPVMGPFFQVFVDNPSAVEHKVTVWAYAVS